MITPAMLARQLDNGSRRAGYDALGYRAATVERSQVGGPSSPTPLGTSADYHTRNLDRETLAAVGDRLHRDSGIYRGIVARFLDSTLGPEGYALDMQTGNGRLNKTIRADFEGFGKRPEVRGLFTWTECQRIALAGIVNNGDGGAILRKDVKKFRFVEGDEIAGGRSPDKNKAPGSRLEQGVELDGDGAPQAFWVAPRSDAGTLERRAAKRIKTGDFVYWPNLERFSQTRGVPVLQSVFSMCHRLEDVCNSEAIAWQTLSKFAAAVTRTGSSGLAYNESRPDNDGRTTGPNGDGQVADRVVELNEAILFYAEPGESVTGIDRNIPGKNFTESTRMFLRLIGLPFGLPLEVILLDYSATSYTASRAALEQAYRMFVAWQRWLKAHLHRPLFEAWLSWQIAAGVYPDRPSTFEHDWIAPEFPWIDHLKEAQAWGMRMDRGLATQTQALRSINTDRDDWANQREAEILDAIERAERLNAAHPGAAVPWELFAGVPISTQRGAAGVGDPYSVNPPNADGTPQGGPEGDGTGSDPAGTPKPGTAPEPGDMPTPEPGA